MNMGSESKKCEKCICTSCINQSVCAKSCGMCKTLGGYVGFCSEECRCEQIEMFEKADGVERPILGQRKYTEGHSSMCRTF